MIYYGKTLSSSGPKLTAVHLHRDDFQSPLYLLQT